MNDIYKIIKFLKNQYMNLIKNMSHININKIYS